MQPEQVTENWTPCSELEKGAVEQQLELLLASPLFHSSKRYPRFLRFVVARALAGQTDQLKERILGVEIFDRPADYDTNTDPIVRVTAAEIRKRIEHYYQDHKHKHEIRMILPAGSYAPQFYWPGHPSGPPAVTSLALPNDASEALNAQPVATLPVVPRSKRTFLPRRAPAVALAGLTLAIAATALWHVTRPPVLKEFWEPFVNSPNPVLICVADQSQYSTIRLRDAADPSHEITLPDKMVALIIDDVSPLVNVAALLRTYGKTSRVLAESNTTLTDLRRAPSIFIGAFDNSWTLRMTSPLRFHFANDAAMNKLWIEDRSNPGNHNWMMDRTVQQTGTYSDYAIVARFVDPNIEQLVVVGAGIGRGGTVAAGEFLVDEQRMDEMLKVVPVDWKRRNIEIVLETQVIGDRSGPPHVSAVYVW
ncbi:MAG TPA: hypothetical protein VNO32_23570 [Candidatus Acidoferrum sp.]|nr:hypothetical protein [Candidatus Acidoferrum sp.]